jgi:hypothetical protein
VAWIFPWPRLRDLRGASISHGKRQKHISAFAVAAVTGSKAPGLHRPRRTANFFGKAENRHYNIIWYAVAPPDFSTALIEKRILVTFFGQAFGNGLNQHARAFPVAC